MSNLAEKNICHYEKKMTQVETILESNYCLFDLPYVVLLDIVSRLSLEDMKSLAASCKAGWNISNDKLLWKMKLWTRAKIVNLSSALKLSSDMSDAIMLIKDPLLIDNKILYNILDPDAREIASRHRLDIQNLLFKVSEPPNNSLTSLMMLNLSERFENLLKSIWGSESVTPSSSNPSDPFTKGCGAPTFLLFGPPETRASKNLALSLIASKDNTFETVGLVKGRPGGVGGGVTVLYEGKVMNMLPIRRARPRLLVEGPKGTMFHEDVAQVVRKVDGLICYMDASCHCYDLENGRPSTVRRSCTVPDCDLYCYEGHYLDILELKAMVNTISTTHIPPVLILMAYMDQTRPQLVHHDSDTDDQTCKVQVLHKRHSPSLLHPFLDSLNLPWAVSEVEVNSLCGIHSGLNWLIKRTLKLKPPI